MKLAERMNRIGVETAFEVLVRARALEAQGRDIIHLEIGEPDFDTPRHIVEAGKQALDQGWTHYGPTQGLPELREAIASYICRTRGIRVGAEHVCVVPGGKPIIFFPLMALLEPGDEVIYPNPGFPIYESMINFLGAKPVPIPLVEDRGFSFDLNVLKDSLSPKTKMLILNSPHNPTGGVIPEADVRAIADMVRDRDLVILSDEIYTRIYFDEEPLSISTLPGMLEKTIILDGFSKTYAMTGWRMGYGVMRADLATHVATADRSTALGHAGEAPCRLAQQPAEQVHDVHAEHHQVLASTATIFLAAAPELEHLPDRSGGDQIGRAHV